MKRFSAYLPLLIFLILVLFYTFLRLYKLPISLEFFNDMGRDFLVLYDWKTSGKPPLLGPQTSTLAFNQSAWYFYLLYPLYLALHGSLFSSVFTVIMYSLLCFSLTFLCIRKYAPKLTYRFLLFLFLATIHPQLVLQQRFVWNPSFVLPTLTITLFGFLILLRNWKTSILWVSAFAVSFAVSMNYSAVPTLIGCIVTAFVLWKRKAFRFISAVCAGLIFWNLPTMFFELRHHFLLTGMMLTRGSLPQARTDVLSKLQSFTEYIFMLRNIPTLTVFVCFFLLTILFAYLNIRKRNTDFTAVFLLFLISFCATLISPFDIQSHYIFPLLTFVLGMIVFLPTYITLSVTIFLTAFWIHPTQLHAYTKPALRTVQQLEQCAQTVCNGEKEPFFVSEQAGFHVFHTGPEYRFLFKAFGCSVQNLETDSTSATRMAVVVDNSQYEHGKTAFNELTIFGPSRIDRRYSCGGNVQVLMLEKIR